MSYISKEVINEFYEQALLTLLWSECDEEGEPLEQYYTVEDMSSETKKVFFEDCKDFVENSFELLCQTNKDYVLGQAGHDFALTRNGHGTGFWDRGLGVIGKALTENCETYGSFHLYVGDDGRLHHG